MLKGPVNRQLSPDGNLEGFHLLGVLREGGKNTYLGSFILDPEDIKCLGLGTTWNSNKGTGLP